MKNRLLLIEDDPCLAETLKDFFEESGLEVYWVSDGAEAMDAYYEFRPHLILTDVILPGKDGFEIVRKIRRYDQKTPVIFMSGTEVSHEAQLKGYHLAGVTHYVIKPVIPEILLAQINNWLALIIHDYQVGEYAISLNQQILQINGTPIKLRDKESRIMQLLLDNQEKLVTREAILVTVWRDDRYDLNKFLDKEVHRLKNHLDAFPRLEIQTVYATGYMLMHSFAT